MNQATTSSWSPMAAGSEDEFTNFLEFGDLQLSFPDFISAPQSVGNGQSDAIMDVSMGDANGLLDGEDHTLHHLEHNSIGPQELQFLESGHGSTDSIQDINMQAELFRHQQYHHQSYPYQSSHIHRQYGIPLTPNSIELHSGHTQFYDAVGAQPQYMYESYAQKRKDQMIFTPLVSPAVIPVDTRNRLLEYSVPGAYFSPLTSPALEAQNGMPPRSVRSAPRSSDTSDTTSPIDMNIDMDSVSPSLNSPHLRKPRRKPSATVSKNPARTVRQSPAMKPQNRKRQSISSTIPPKGVSAVLEEARRSKRVENSLSHTSMPATHDSSGAESISPEPLSEILMPPPATPRSDVSGRSPHLSGNQVDSPNEVPSTSGNQPATPASLMKIKKQNGKDINGQHQTSSLREQASIAEADMEQIMESIVLPEPAAGPTKPTLAPINTAQANDDDTTPTITARKLPNGPASAPLSAMNSMFPSPQLGAMASPTNSTSGKRAEQRPIGRSSKKRNSATSVQVSPALRPKISPSIKPLLPDGATITSETSTLLLASKSNYQNILEGTHLPGVSYPEALSTNLTSKRTSHKIAEQGRRNRINTALQEIASLLPPSTPNLNGTTRSKEGSGSGGDSGPGAASHAMQQSSSKANTVELAIDYIKALQTELKDVRGKLEVAEKKLGKGTVTT